MSRMDSHIARGQSNIVTVWLAHTAEAEEFVLACWRLKKRGWIDKLLKEEAE